MKIVPPQYRQVESLGRNNLGAVGSVARAKGAQGSAQSNVLNYMAKVGAQFIERKENAEHNTSKTNTMLRFADVEEKLGAKTSFTAQEAKALPEGSVNLTNSDGSPRNDIPAYEVYPYLLEEAQRKIIKQEAEGVSNPLLREDYFNLANGIASKTNLKTALKAANDQREYLKKASVEAGSQLAMNGNRMAALKQTEENADFTGLERIQLDRKYNEMWEWGNDDRILNTGDLALITDRYTDLRSEDYGKGEEDFLGTGKASGKFNLAADIKRFESTIKALTAKQNNAIVRATEEDIRSAKNGNLDNNRLTSTGDYKEYINSLPIKEDTKDRLTRDASVGIAEGRARNEVLMSPGSESRSLITQAVSILSETASEYNDEADATIKGIKDAYKYQQESLRKDASSFLSKHSPATQSAEKKWREQTNKELKSAAFINLLQVSRAEQERLETPPEAINFLTVPQIQAFKEEAAKVGRSPAGASALIKQMDDMRQVYSTEWPQVYTQLIREGALSVEHIVASNIEDRSLQTRYVDAIKNQPDIEKRQVYKDNITQVRRDVEKQIQALRATSITLGAMPNVAQGLGVDEQYNALSNGIVQLIMSDLSATGEYDSNAAENYVNKITEDKWELYDHVRIPKTKTVIGANGKAKIVPQDTAKIAKGLKLSRKNLTLSPDLEFYIRPIDRISGVDQQAILRREFLDFHQPQTNMSESGVTFKWASGQPVYILRNGTAQELGMSYEDLESFGSYTTKTKRNRRVYGSWELK